MSKEELMSVPFGLGKKNPYNRYFTGTSYLNILQKDGVLVANVTFEEGCRNNWHIHNAKKNGVSRNEIVESLTHIAMYVGWPKIWAALNYVKEVYQED